MRCLRPDPQTQDRAQRGRVKALGGVSDRASNGRQQPSRQRRVAGLRVLHCVTSRGRRPRPEIGREPRIWPRAPLELLPLVLTPPIARQRMTWVSKSSSPAGAGTWASTCASTWPAMGTRCAGLVPRASGSLALGLAFLRDGVRMRWPKHGAPAAARWFPRSLSCANGTPSLGHPAPRTPVARTSALAVVVAPLSAAHGQPPALWPKRPCSDAQVRYTFNTTDAAELEEATKENPVKGYQANFGEQSIVAARLPRGPAEGCGRSTRLSAASHHSHGGGPGRDMVKVQGVRRRYQLRGRVPAAAVRGGRGRSSRHQRCTRCPRRPAPPPPRAPRFPNSSLLSPAVPRHLVAACQRQREEEGLAPLFVHFSTDQVYDGSSKPGGAWAEGDPTGPVNAYGRTKLAGERFLQESWDNHVILRCSLIVGRQPPVPVSRPLFAQFVEEALRERRPTEFAADEYRRASSRGCDGSLAACGS